jgi:hypothetical protein
MKRWALVAVALLGMACSGDTPTAPDDIDVSPIQVDAVDVAILESFPAQATAHVRGVVGDGCSSLHSTDIRREGNVVTVTILRQRPADAICTQIALLYDEQLRLPGEYPPGDYVLRVNAVQVPFTT